MNEKLEPPSLGIPNDPLGQTNGAIGPIRSPEGYDAERVRLLLWRRVPPSDALDPSTLKATLDQFDHGYLSTCAKIWWQLRTRDHVVASVAAKRTKAVARMPWEVLIKSEIDPSQKEEAEAHKQALIDFYRGVEVTDILAQDVQGGFRELVSAIMDAVAYQYSALEITWEPPTDSKPFTACFRKWPLYSFEARYGHLRWLPVPEILTGLTMDPDKWLVAVGEGLMRATCILCAFRKYSLSDWLTFSEKFGLPFVLGKTPAAKGSAEWNNMVDAVTGFVGDGGAVVNIDALIEIVTAGASAGTLPFPPLLEYLDRWITVLWRGADLSTMSAAGGQGQGASIQGDETDMLSQDDAQWVSGILNTKIDPQVISYLFGAGTDPLAYVQIMPPDHKDQAREVAVDQFLLQSGAPLGVDDTLERYGRVRPAPDAPILQAPGGSTLFQANDSANPNGSPQMGSAAHGQNGEGADPGEVLPAMGNSADGNNATLSSPKRTEFASGPKGLSDDELPSATLVNSVATLLNSRDLAAADVKLRSELTDRVAEGLARSLQPIRKRLEQIAKVADPAEQQRQLVFLQGSLAEHVMDKTGQRAVANIFAESLASAFFNGVVAGTK